MLLMMRGYRRTIGHCYPFIQFMSVVVFPIGYWICVVELSTYGTQDNTFSLSFGQVCSHAWNVNKETDVV